jgi:8-oxo-dGTP diphosphatase
MNSELYDKQYKIPENILKYVQTTLISNPNGEGVKRAKYMLKNGVITYQVLKRLKNFFDYFNPQTDSKVQYALAGGDQMKTFIETTLAADRSAVERSKENTRDIHADLNLGLDPYDASVNLNESKDDLKKNAVAIIVDKDRKILLLKRADIKETWMPSKWALVGGGIEEGENPKEAVEREIKEETKLVVDKTIEMFRIQRHSDSIEFVFVCEYVGEPTDVVLNGENTAYGWYEIDEINYLDIVPHLVEYITLAFKKYE